MGSRSLQNTEYEVDLDLEAPESASCCLVPERSLHTTLETLSLRVAFFNFFLISECLLKINLSKRSKKH